MTAPNLPDPNLNDSNLPDPNLNDPGRKDLNTVWPHPGPVVQDLPIPYTEVDLKGVIRMVNEAACRLHGMHARQLIGCEIWDFLPRDEAAESRAAFLQLVQSGDDPPVVRRSIYTSAGEYRTHEVRRRLLRNADGVIYGMNSVTVDVSDVVAAHNESRRAKLWLESVVEAIPQAVIVTDALGFVRFINPAAQRLLGRSAASVLGLQIEKSMPILRAVSRSGKSLSFRMALDEPWNGDVDILNAARETITVWLSASPIIEKEKGFTNGVVLVLRSTPIRKTAGPLPLSISQPAQEANLT